MFEIDKAKFGAFIAELRKEKKITQKELAELLLISDKAISKWETGNSIPDVALLVPLAEILEVSVTELLECRRMERVENLDISQADILVKKVIEISEEEKGQNRKKNKRIYFICALIALIEMFGACVLSYKGVIDGAMDLTSILITGLAAVGFGAYFWIFMKEKLPAYYDENKISVYVDGVLHMNMPGVYYNNNNWPYIVKALRGWSIAGMVAFPAVYLLLSKLFAEAGLYTSLIIVFGFIFGGLFIPIYILGRKYQYKEGEKVVVEDKSTRKKNFAIFGIILGIVLVSLVFGGGGSIASGSKMMYFSNKSRGYWSASYEYFNGFEQRNIWVDEDGILDIHIQTEEGQLNLTITDEDHQTIYEEKNLETSDFQINATGKVTVRVEAMKHKGSFMID